jgi:hypothetical protein
MVCLSRIRTFANALSLYDFVIEVRLCGMSMKRINAVIIAIAVAMAVSVTTAQTPVLSEAAEQFIARHADYAAILEAESRIAQAIKSNDTKFLIDAGKRFEKDTLPFTEEKHPEHQAIALRLGPCHYASILILGLPQRIASELAAQPKRKAVRVKALVPEDIVAMFVEHIGRCERIKRLPKSVRLIQFP